VLTAVFTAPPAPVVDTSPVKVQVSPASIAPACGVSVTVMVFASVLNALAAVNAMARLAHVSDNLEPSLDVALLTVNAMTGFTSRATPVVPDAGSTDDKVACGVVVGVGVGVEVGVGVGVDVPPPPPPHATNAASTKPVTMSLKVTTLIESPC